MRYTTLVTKGGNIITAYDTLKSSPSYVYEDSKMKWELDKSGYLDMEIPVPLLHLTLRGIPSLPKDIA